MADELDYIHQKYPQTRNARHEMSWMYQEVTEEELQKALQAFRNDLDEFSAKHVQFGSYRGLAACLQNTLNMHEEDWKKPAEMRTWADNHPEIHRYCCRRKGHVGLCVRRDVENSGVNNREIVRYVELDRNRELTERPHDCVFPKSGA